MKRVKEMLYYYGAIMNTIVDPTRGLRLLAVMLRYITASVLVCKGHEALSDLILVWNLLDVCIAGMGDTVFFNSEDDFKKE